MPVYPGQLNSDVSLTFPFTGGLLTPAPQGLSRGGFTWLVGTVVYPTTQPAAFESLVAPVASTRAAVQIGNALPLQALSIELEFSAAPGAFELDIQDADTDADAFYQAIPNAAITVVSAQNIARFELNPFAGKFVRVFMKTLTNAVGWRVKVSGQ